MDGDDHPQAPGGSGNGGSRWNPTKEQISLLEGLYRQGLRTPTADQIQHITHRLKAYGHIEGKNVFYWFQNHKARQRQKQKQKLNQKQHITFGYYNHHCSNLPQQYPCPPPPLVFCPPPHPNVVCSPYYIPNDHLGFYPQVPNVQLPTAAAGASNETLRYNPPKHENPRSQNEEQVQLLHSDNIRQHHQETLDLFPIHPTGILRTRNGIPHRNHGADYEDEEEDNEDKIKNPNSSSYENNNTNYDNSDDHHPCFDFFCRN